MLRTLLVSACLLSALLSGCASNEQAPAASPSAVDLLGGRSRGLEPRADAVAPGPARFETVAESEAAWYLAAFDVDATHGSVAGFRWTVPADSLRTHPDSKDLRALPLEVAFLTPEHQAVEVFAFGVFTLDAKPQLLTLHLGSPMDTTTRGVGQAPQTTRAEAYTSPGLLLLSEDLVSEGDELGILLSVRGNVSAFGAAWRILDQYPSSYDAPKSTEAFLDSLQGEPAAVVPVYGQGVGYAAAAYLEVNSLHYGLEMRLGDVEVTQGISLPDLRPVASVRDIALRTSFVSPQADDGGWGIALGGYAAWTGAYQWEMKADVHGVSVASSGSSAAGLRYPFFMVMGGNEPQSEANLRIQTGSLNSIEVLALLSVDYGASLPLLLGVSLTETTSGPMSHAVVGSDLVLRTGVTEVRLLGALA
jgi:hypothetical protein